MFDPGRQLTRRIQSWRQALAMQIYQPVGEPAWEGFMTFGRLTPSEALEREFSPLESGTVWGDPWQYGWFKTSIKVSDSLAGERIVLFPGIGGEMLVWVDKLAAGSQDRRHPYVTVARSGERGRVYSILAESYAGHGEVPENCGPCPDTSSLYRIPDGPLRRVEGGSYGIWKEVAYQLWIDVETLWSELEVLPDSSLRAQKIARALVEFTRIVDFEAPVAEKERSFLLARRVLEPVLSCVNGSTAPLMTIFGQSHIDLAWKWPYFETTRKVGRTYANQLALMREYPFYRFLMCEPCLLEALRKYHPQLFSEAIARVGEGRMIAEGAFWVESDTNIPSGESLVRQLVRGQRWFQTVCGSPSRMGWLPDTFGFSGALPQLLRGCGVPYFSTQKLLRCDPECYRFPYNDFIWEGIDGSSVLAHMHYRNNTVLTPAELAGRWEHDRRQRSDIDGMLFPFGYGDGGGGPDRDMLEVARRVSDLEGIPRTVMESPVEYFRRLEEKGTYNRWTGELYLAWHRGTYTAQARTKRLNRAAEISLREAEFWSSLATFVAGAQYPDDALARCWDRLLFNQFHDVIAGACTHRVHLEAETELEDVRRQADSLAHDAVGRFSQPAEHCYAVFNSLSWDRNGWICVPSDHPIETVVDTSGSPLPWYRSKDGVHVAVHVPACGWNTIRLLGAAEDGTAAMSGSVSCLRVGDSYVLRNEHLSISVDRLGRFVSLTVAGVSREFLGAPGNDMRMYQDVNPDYDAWELGRMYRELPVELDDRAEISVMENNSRIAVLSVKRRLHDSDMEQWIIVRDGYRYVECRTRIDWRERHKLLKVAFPTTIRSDVAVNEIQFGFIRRPSHGNTEHDRDQYEVCNHRYTALCEGRCGFSLLNDSKYGISVDGDLLALSLLRAPLAPDPEADQGLQEFSYAVLPFSTSFEDSHTVRDGYAFNTPLSVVAGDGGVASCFSISEPNVVLETVKRADERDGMIIRLYEALECDTVCSVHLPDGVFRVFKCDLLENPLEELPLDDGSVALRMHPFEIVTLLLDFQSSAQ